ncbi:MAG TPA: PTS transporter subunit EIIA [Firmicutes bacterium]|uniref:PTS sugar transporter subunit IIA n=1 Tax=Capillibacterium thermochitinicola TaxID=2699427 RepID=A0A8J6I3N5_9FIRM|nr:fructose PTS transporter subunit IIA [Capillibacterium thermochitinicola]MBA2133889.1 PTS sugar transporter subunit IIA [Capillibacterium thermochitinicola]HHW13187.1 PTS transporter subunit EIIA [Bacillota bacterium]
MKVGDLLNSQLINLELKATSKEEAINELAALMAAGGYLHDVDEYIAAVMEREAIGSTGVGMGVAIPHGKSKAVREACVAFGKSEPGVDFSGPDGPAHLIFLIAVPENADNQHLKILANLSRMLIHEEVRSKLKQATSHEEVLNALNKRD